MSEMGGMPSNDELVPFFTFEDIDYALENGYAAQNVNRCDTLTLRLYFIHIFNSSLN